MYISRDFAAQKPLFPKRLLLLVAPLVKVSYCMPYGPKMLYWNGKSTPGCAAAAGDDRRQVRGKFLQHCPLVESCVRAAPHRYFAIAIRLLRQPFHHVVAVLALIHKWLELSAGIPPAPH